MINTIAIAYNAGAYGTYVEWCLTTLCSHGPIQEPFNPNGNSHQFVGNFVSGLPGWLQYQHSGDCQQFVRLHPKTRSTESLSENLNQILESVPGMIYLYPDHHSQLLVINNYLVKAWDDWWTTQFALDIDQSLIYSNWAVTGVAIGEIPQWIRREFLSHYLMPAWYAQLEWYHLDQWHHKRAHTVLIHDLLYNFESVMTQLQHNLNLDFVRPITDIVPYHRKNLLLQTNLAQDQLCAAIVDSVQHNKTFDWSDQTLPLASESYVQWQLRNIGWEIQCHELDKFPTNSVHLRELLYAI